MQLIVAPNVIFLHQVRMLPEQKKGRYLEPIVGLKIKGGNQFAEVPLVHVVEAEAAIESSQNILLTEKNILKGSGVFDPVFLRRNAVVAEHLTIHLEKITVGNGVLAPMLDQPFCEILARKANNVTLYDYLIGIQEP